MITPDDLIRHGLTRRELQVCDLIARGLPPREIASELSVLTRTVYQYEWQIRCKLQVGSRCCMIAQLNQKP